MFNRKEKQNDKMSNFEQRLDKIANDSKEITEKLIQLQEPIQDAVKVKMKLATIQAMCGNKSIENRVVAASNYEFGLWVMKKQLMDQLLYVEGTDSSLISTVQFKSVEDLSRNLISLIDVLLRENNS